MKVNELIDYMEATYKNDLLKVNQNIMEKPTPRDKYKQSFIVYFKDYENGNELGRLKQENFYNLIFYFNNNLKVIFPFSFIESEEGEHLAKIGKRIKWYLSSSTNCTIELTATDSKLTEEIIDKIASIDSFKSKEWEAI